MKDIGTIIWPEIEQALSSMRTVQGGFSSAHRGIVTLKDGRHVFVKLGVDDNTKGWAKKEIAVYHFLQKQNYSYIPQLLATNSDRTAFAIEPLEREDGWDWSDSWTKERLDKTLEAMDALATIIPAETDKSFFEQSVIDESDDGWRPLANSEDKQQALLTKLRSAGSDHIVDGLDFGVMAKRSQGYIFRNDQLVHNDIRADNGAWNAQADKVKLVDWNWTQLGDRQIDLAATLTHVQKTGFDILPDYIARLNSSALHWMAGFWFNAAIKPIWPGGPEHLRDHQLKAGVTALELSERIH